MRYAAVLVVAVVCSGALASQPGSPLDCSDWVFVAPGLSCSVFLPPPLPAETIDAAWWARGNNVAVDNEGFAVIVRENASAGRIEIRRRNAVGEQLLAYVPNGRDAGAWRDILSPNSECSGSCWGSAPRIAEGFSFDAVNGRLLLPLVSWCIPGCPSDGRGHWVAAIEGFTTLFEVAQNYQPPAPALGFRVPVMPEGMAGADHFDTYSGPLTKPIELAKAQPIACDYPATAPAVGDYLTVADPLPDPAPGTGRYYVTSATYQGATRYGRKTTGGVLSGRDPAVLPTCTANNDNGAIPIDAPTTITQAGSYILTRDISVNDGPAITFTFNASHASLNLNGFQLERTGTTYGGAISGGGQFIEIHGGEIAGGGIALFCSFCTIRDLTVRDSGVFLEGNHNTVERTRHFSSYIWLDDAVGGIARDNVLQSGFIGIESGDRFQVTHNALTGGYISLRGDTNGAVLDNVVTGSSTHGIFGFGSGNRFAGNMVSGSAGFGLHVQWPSSVDCTYSGNVLRGNLGTGCANPAGNADFCDEGTGNESGGDNFMPDLR